jgi:hypothetical protein
MNAPANSAPSNRIAMGEYHGTVSNTVVIPFGDRPVIFTTIKLDGPGERHVTHAVRLHNADAKRIGINELRSGFPEQLAKCDSDLAVIKAVNRGVLKGLPVIAAVVPQLKKGIPVRLDNGEAAYNIRLRSIVPMSDEALEAALDRIVTDTPADADAIASA